MRNRRTSTAVLTLGVVALALALITSAPARAAFPGSNGRIVLSRDDGNGNSLGLFLMNPDGTGLAQLTSTGDAEAAFSSDGKRIVFSSTRDGNSEIYSMNADGTGQTRRTNDPAPDAAPNWSPDGSKIVYQHQDGINVMNADGSGVTQISPSGSAPVWAPNGSKIAFADTRDRNAIYLMNSDGSGVTRLTAGGDPNQVTGDTNPDWSPDSTRIAFQSGGSACSQHIRVVDVGTGAEHDVTGSDNRCFDLSPTWSPDGSLITFTSANFGNGEPDGIYVANADGSGAHVVDNSSADLGDDWQASATPASNNTTPRGNFDVVSGQQVPEAGPAPIVRATPRFTG